MSYTKFNRIVLCLSLASRVIAGDSTHVKISAGLCVKKMAGFYWMNGLSADINHEKILKGKINLGMTLSSSSLGSAFLSNAIPVHAVELYAQKNFRPEKYLHPYAGLNAGFAFADFGSREFGNISGKTALLSVEGGIRYTFTLPFEVAAGMGYNVISGTGEKGPGFIYPVYFTGRILYRIHQ
jgi:hypothetical protein